MVVLPLREARAAADSFVDSFRCSFSRNVLSFPKFSSIFGKSQLVRLLDSILNSGPLWEADLCGSRQKTAGNPRELRKSKSQLDFLVSFFPPLWLPLFGRKR